MDLKAFLQIPMNVYTFSQSIPLTKQVSNLPKIGIAQDFLTERVRHKATTVVTATTTPHFYLLICKW